MQTTNSGLMLKDINPVYIIEEIQAVIEAKFIVSENLIELEI